MDTIGKLYFDEDKLPSNTVIQGPEDKTETNIGLILGKCNKVNYRDLEDTTNQVENVASRHTDVPRLVTIHKKPRGWNPTWNGESSWGMGNQDNQVQKKSTWGQLSVQDQERSHVAWQQDVKHGSLSTDDDNGDGGDDSFDKYE